MDPAIVLFGLGIGVLVGMTGMGGGSLMTPLLILIFGIQPTTAIGTDIFYSAVTKTVGGWRHLRMKTVNMELVKWLALGSVPAAVSGVALVSILQDHIGEARLDSLVYAVLGGTLLMVGIITLARALILRTLIDERDRFEVERRHKVAAVVIGATTGFVIGITSAGSGTVIAILLIAVYRLAPKKVVGTDVFHAAILLWAAGIAHWLGGNVDFVLAGNILLGSVPGVIIGAALSDRAPQGFIRTALGVVLVGSGIVTIQKGDPNVWPVAAGVAAVGLGLILYAPHWLNQRRARQRQQEADQARTLARTLPAD
ncbi:MAG: sulfite exporter TauE/SafE family protein [Solirubrobacterales bacterium]